MKYDLLKEPWIPVRDKKNAIKEVGILELFETAPDLVEITDAYPNQEFGIYRMIMTLLMDVYKPENTEVLEDLLEDGRFDMNKIRDYLNGLQVDGARFDLFDDLHPFFQVPKSSWDSKKESTPVAALLPMQPSGNNHIHFDHEKETVFSLSYAEAARAICAVNVFCTAGAQGYPSSVNGAPPVFTLVKGNNLYETLIYGIVTSDQIEDYDNTPPLWRWDVQIEAKKKVPTTSLLSGLTFPCRRITLIPDNNGRVSSMYFAQGMDYVGYDGFLDPYVSYVTTESGRFSIKPKIDIEPWRNLGTLIDYHNGTAPMVVQQYANMTDENRVCVTMYHVVTNQAAYQDASVGQYIFATNILKSPIKIETVQSAINECEWKASLLKNLMTQLKLNLGYDKKEKNLNRLMDNCVLKYYDKCKSELLTEVIESLATKEANTNNIKESWEKKVWGLMLQEFDNFVTSIGTRSKVLLQAELAKRVVLSKEKKGGKELE